MNQFAQLLQGILNPNTGKTFSEENRWVEIGDESDRLVIRYKRDGISIEQKKMIEQEMIDLLKSKVNEDKILIFTVSENSKGVEVTDFNKAKVDQQSSKAEHVHGPNCNHGDDHKHDHGHKKTAVNNDSANLKTGHGPMGQKKRIPNVKKVIAVSSNKGGVGKSTVAVNLCFALKQLGFKVGLLDADIYGPSTPLMLNQKGTKPAANEEKKILPVDAYGVGMMSFGLFIGDEDPVIWRGPMLGGVLNQFLFDVAWGELDYLILDLPPGTGDVQLSLVQLTQLDGVVVVSTPQDVAWADTIKGLKMFQQLNIPIIGVVENMSYFICDGCDKRHYIFGQGKIQEYSEKLSLPVLGQIPMDQSLQKYSDQGVPLLSQEQFNEHPISQEYFHIARSVHHNFFPDDEIAHATIEKKPAILERLSSLWKK